MVNVSGAIVASGGGAGGPWSVRAVTENIAQFGYAPADFASGRLTWRQIVHPDDIGWVEREAKHCPPKKVGGIGRAASRVGNARSIRQ